MSNPILVVDQVLTLVDAETSQPSLRDYVLSMVFANAAARAAGKAAAADSAERAQAFASQWWNQLGYLGWVTTVAGSMQAASSASRPTTVADQIEAQSGSPAVGEALAALQALAGSETEAERALAAMFWEAAADGDVLVGSVGRVSEGGDGPVLELATFTLRLDRLRVRTRGMVGWKTEPLDATSAADLFEPVVAASVDLSVSHLSAALQPGVFAGRREDLIGKLRGRSEEHYLTLPPHLITAVN